MLELRASETDATRRSWGPLSGMVVQMRHPGRWIYSFRDSNDASIPSRVGVGLLGDCHRVADPILTTGRTRRTRSTAMSCYLTCHSRS